VPSLLEPIVGEGGIYECSTEFRRECRALADRHCGPVFDEIQYGLGRTGTIFAFQAFGVPPRFPPDSVAQRSVEVLWLVALEYLAIVEEEKLLENLSEWEPICRSG
jgi:Aminotransferase class-III